MRSWPCWPARCVASGLADAGYMFVLGCSRFRLHALVTATAAWLYAGTMWLLAVTGEITVVHATLIWVRDAGGQGGRAADRRRCAPRAWAAPSRGC